MHRLIPTYSDVVVVGSGQSGLAASYHLKLHGIDHVVVDENENVGDVWRNRWDSLRLFTPGRFDGLPGMKFTGGRATYPSKDQIADYLATYAATFDLPIQTGVRVERLSAVDGGFKIVHELGEATAANVVVATGAYHSPRIPPFAADLAPEIVQLHSSAYRAPPQVREGPVLVVGAANSGAEIALDLSGDHRVWLSGRDVGQEPTSAGTVPDRLVTPLIWFAAHHVLEVSRPWGRKVRDSFLDPPRGIPLGQARRKDIQRAGIERVPRTVDVVGGLPVLDDGRQVEPNTVVWCTGFTPDYSWIEVPVFADNGYPIHRRGIVESAPGLYFMGLLFQYSLSSALIGGVGRDAEYVVRHIRRHRSDLRSGARRNPAA